MNLNQIRYFLGLARELHFWNAAEKMHIAQSSLSRQIKALEDELGIRLFERNKREVKLSVAGAFLDQEWQRMLAEIDNVHLHARQMARGEAGQIRIGHVGSVAHSTLPELLEAVGRQYPKLKVGLSELPPEKISQALLEFHIDIGLRREGANDKRLEAVLLSKEPFALVLPDNHPLALPGDHPQAGNGIQGLEELKDEYFILPPLRTGDGYMETLLNVFRQYGFYPKTRFESNFGATILSLVAKGLGISVLPSSYARLGAAGVRFIPIPHEVGLYLIFRRGDPDPTVKIIKETVQTFVPSGSPNDPGGAPGPGKYS
jgi:DNA-binding transcriptional LysR family regulator